jgi:hypothetical protein
MCICYVRQFVTFVAVNSMLPTVAICIIVGSLATFRYTRFISKFTAHVLTKFYMYRSDQPRGLVVRVSDY